MVSQGKGFQSLAGDKSQATPLDLSFFKAGEGQAGMKMSQLSLQVNEKLYLMKVNEGERLKEKIGELLIAKNQEKDSQVDK